LAWPVFSVSAQAASPAVGGEWKPITSLDQLSGAWEGASTFNFAELEELYAEPIPVPFTMRLAYNKAGNVMDMTITMNMEKVLDATLSIMNMMAALNGEAGVSKDDMWLMMSAEMKDDDTVIEEGYTLSQTMSNPDPQLPEVKETILIHRSGSAIRLYSSDLLSFLPDGQGLELAKVF
jgi:hypothetical protein